MQNILQKLVERKKRKLLHDIDRNKNYCFYEFSSGIQTTQTEAHYKPRNPNKKFMKSLKSSLQKSKEKQPRNSHPDKSYRKISRMKDRSVDKIQEYSIQLHKLPKKFCLTSQRLRPRLTYRLTTNNKETNNTISHSQVGLLQKCQQQQQSHITHEDDYLHSKLKENIKYKIQQKLRKRKSRESIHKQKMQKYIQKSFKITDSPNFPSYRF